MSDVEKECRGCSVTFMNLHQLSDWRLIQTGMCENCYQKQLKEYEDIRSKTTSNVKQGRKDDSAKTKHSHYHKDVSHIDTLDIYWICDLYVKDDSGCIQHAVKKLLCAGERGIKDNVKDLQEAIDTIQRKIEILKVKGE